MDAKHSLLVNGLELFALVEFAVSQPLLDILRRFPGFLVAHQASPLEIILLILSLVVLLPGAVWGVEAVVRRVLPGLYGRLHLLFVAFFVTLFVLPALKLIVQHPGAALLCLGVASGFLAAVLYARTQSLRSFLTRLAVAPCCSSAFSFFTKPIAKFLFTGQNPPVALGKVGVNVPVFLLIFDELPLTSLLDECVRIGAVPLAAYR